MGGSGNLVLDIVLGTNHIDRNNSKQESRAKKKLAKKTGSVCSYIANNEIISLMNAADVD